MKRELEFRVYDYDAKKMRYLKNEHDFICFNSDGSAYYHNMQTGLGEWFSDLMQYTGLKDKNGVKIFEGDIVHYYDFTSVYSREITGKVIYSQNRMFEIEYDDEIIKNHKTTRPLVCNEHPIFTEKKIEVIGNIYEDTKGSDKDVNITN